MRRPGASGGGPRSCASSRPTSTGAARPRRLVRAEVTSVDPRALGGKATRKEIAVLLDGRAEGPRLHLLLYVPNGIQAPVPAFLALNFGGNHTVTAEPGIALPRGWMPSAEPGVVDHRATDGGAGATRAPGRSAKILAAGFALVTAYYGDLEPDFPEGRSQGVRAAFGPAKGGGRPRRRRLGRPRRRGPGGSAAPWTPSRARPRSTPRASPSWATRAWARPRCGRARRTSASPS